MTKTNTPSVSSNIIAPLFVESSWRFAAANLFMTLLPVVAYSAYMTLNVPFEWWHAVVIGITTSVLSPVSMSRLLVVWPYRVAASRTLPLVKLFAVGIAALIIRADSQIRAGMVGNIVATATVVALMM